MKQLIITSLMLVLFISVSAQKKIQLSFNGGPSINWMKTDNPVGEREKFVFGYDYGMNADFYLTGDERYSILTGLIITNVGGEISYRTNSAFSFSGAALPPLSKITYNLRYAEVPLAIKLKTNQFHRSKFWGQFGLSTMLNIKSKGDSNNGMLNKSNINDEINMFNVAMNIGLGLEYDLGGNNSLLTGIVFQNGLTDITTDNAFDDKTIVNSLKLKVGLVF